MKTYLLLFFILILLGIITANSIVVEENPCRLINCRVRIFGFWQMEAEQLGTTPDGLAICHCPHEPEDILYYVSTYRKY